MGIWILGRPCFFSKVVCDEPDPPAGAIVSSQRSSSLDAPEQFRNRNP